MSRATFFIICLTFVLLCGVKSNRNCDDLGIVLYEDLGCKAVRKDGRHCPIKYECDDFTTSKNSCLFRGRKYALDEQIDDNITNYSCNVGCYCNSPGEGFSGASFACAVLDCFDWLGPPIKPGCYGKYEVDKCCSVGRNCPSEDNVPGECNVDGKKYKEGELFFPKNTCMRCVCPKNFDGKFKAPYCKRITCETQINNAEELHNKCAPFYGKSDGGKLCCPLTWICPSSCDKIVQAEHTKSNSELTCAFGTKTLKLGDGFEREINDYGSNRTTKCECKLPPMLTCKEV